MPIDRVLVTGGAGFIGSHVVEALLGAGYEPHVVDNLSTGSRANVPAGIALHKIDIRHEKRLARLFRRLRPRYVCHLAAQVSVSRSVNDPTGDAVINIVGWLNVLKACQGSGVERVIFASSGGALYGDVQAPAGEDAPIGPVSPYAISKWTGEQYLRFWSAQHGVDGVALRFANVYGPRQEPHSESGVVAIFTRQLLAGQAPVIYGDGSSVRDYVYVTDVARANVMALQGSLPGPAVALNIGTGTGTDLAALEQMLRREVAGRLPPDTAAALPPVSYSPARSGDLKSSIVSPARAAAVLGWHPEVDLAEGLRRTVDWYGPA